MADSDRIRRSYVPPAIRELTTKQTRAAVLRGHLEEAAELAANVYWDCRALDRKLLLLAPTVAAAARVDLALLESGASCIAAEVAEAQRLL